MQPIAYVKIPHDELVHQKTGGFGMKYCCMIPIEQGLAFGYEIVACPRIGKKTVAGKFLVCVLASTKEIVLNANHESSNCPMSLIFNVNCI